MRPSAQTTRSQCGTSPPGTLNPVPLKLTINQSRIFRVVQVIKSLQDPLEAGNNLPGISDNVRERGLEQETFLNADGRLTETGAD